MKLEPNMYVRTIDGKIYIVHELVHDKNDEICSTLTWKNPQEKIGKCTLVSIEYITKASHNIIDLIEKCDYVNGYKVENIEDNGNFKILIIDIGNNYEHILYDCFIEDGFFLEIREEQIKTILTHEVFEREAYKIE